MSEKPKHPGGRPSDYAQDVADIILERIADGESLRAICADDAMPARSTVRRWLAAHEEFRHQYTLARVEQADTLFDEILNIADDGTNDWMAVNRGDDQRWVENGEALGRSRIRIDARKWLAGKLAPKKYGEKQSFELSGNAENPVHTVTRIELVAGNGDSAD